MCYSAFVRKIRAGLHFGCCWELYQICFSTRQLRLQLRHKHTQSMPHIFFLCLRCVLGVLCIVYLEIEFSSRSFFDIWLHEYIIYIVLRSSFEWLATFIWRRLFRKTALMLLRLLLLLLLLLVLCSVICVFRTSTVSHAVGLLGCFLCLLLVKVRAVALFYVK